MINRDSWHRYEFGPFCLSTNERLLYAGDKVVQLSPKVVDTLMVLVENNGRVLNKDFLMKTLWPDSFVEESSLSQNISLLRKALTENGGDQYIETVPKRGYRFVADVKEITGSDDQFFQTIVEERMLAEPRQQLKPFVGSKVLFGDTQPRMRTVYLGLVAALILVSIAAAYLVRQRRGKGEAFVPRSIAVLPFKTIGAAEEPDVVGLGIANAIIVDLSSLKRATVLPTSSVFKYTQREKDAISIGRELGVDAVLDGTVQRADDRVHVTALLIRSSDGKSLWSGKFDGNYRDTFALQESISQELTSALALNLGGNDKRSVQRRPENVTAYNNYLFGLYFWQKRSGKDDLLKAISYLQQSIKEDPNLAVAHAILGQCYFGIGISDWDVMPRAEAIARARTEAESALELDSNLADAYTVLAYISLDNRDFAKGEEHFRRALQLDPNNAEAHLHYGTFLFTQARLAEADVELKQAQELAPLWHISQNARAHVLLISRDYDGAISASQKSIEVQPDSGWAHANLVQAYAMKGMFHEALREVETMKGGDPVLFARTKIYAEALAGRTADAKRDLGELRQSPYEKQITPYQYAVLYASIGDKDKAFESLAKAVDDVGKRESKKFLSFLLELDPQLDAIRGDARFREYFNRLHG